MHVAFLNPQGNFDPSDSYWTEHPDFGGQLVYVKEVALAMAAQGHRADIITRQIVDPTWPEFAAPIDHYPEHPNVRILRMPCGPPTFLPKEQLWPCLGSDWVYGIINFYRQEGDLPDFLTAHYADGGLVGALLHQQTGVPFSFTGHSLGAQKMDKLHVSADTLSALDARFHFKERITAERIAMNHADVIIVSTEQEKCEQYSHQAYHGAIDPLGADRDRFAVIPPGVNQHIFSPETNTSDAVVSERLQAALARDLPPDRRSLPLVLVSSRLDQKKNHLGVVRAFTQSASLRAIANLGIVVRGLENPLRQRAKLPEQERAILDEIVRTLDENNLWDTVTSFPLNSQAELAAAYRWAAQQHGVFALTAHYEPFGLAPLEAMSCGLPAVVTRNGGPQESLYDAVAHKKFGVLVNPTDPNDIARGLLEALSPESAWHYYHCAGMERVNSRYTWERTAAGYLHTIERAQSAASAPRPRLSIPAYFTQPHTAPEIPLAKLAALYGTQKS